MSEYRVVVQYEFELIVTADDEKQAEDRAFEALEEVYVQSPTVVHLGDRYSVDSIEPYIPRSGEPAWYEKETVDAR